MTASEPARVLVLAHDNVGALEHALVSLGCDVFASTDVFEAMAEVSEDPPDAVLLDLTMTRDDAHALAEWLRDQDADPVVVGIAEPVAAASTDVGDLCDELITVAPTPAVLAAALGLQPAVEEGERRLQVKVNADLLDAHEVRVPPDRAATSDGDKRALIVGLGSHAEAPRYDE